MSFGFGLVLRALVTGPARRRPARVLLPVVGVAIGVAAVAAIHHANRSVTASFQEAADAIAGRSDFVVDRAGGDPGSTTSPRSRFSGERARSRRR